MLEDVHIIEFSGEPSSTSGEEQYMTKDSVSPGCQLQGAVDN